MTLNRRWSKANKNSKPPRFPTVEDALSLASEWDPAREECLQILLQHVVASLHDIKGSLATINLTLATFSKKFSGKECDKKKLDLALQQVECIAGTIEDIFLSIKQGYLLDHKIPEDIHVILERCLQNIQYITDTHHILLSRNYHSTPLSVLVNPEQIERSLINICQNAIEAMKSEGKLSVTTHLLSDSYRTWVAIRISDTGTGIAHEKIDHVFQPFYTTKQKSAGLGLHIAQKIITDHQGTIEITSEQETGTSVFIRLPFQGESHVTKNPYCG